MTSELSAWQVMALIGDHLWQSTLFAGAAALLVLLLRHNRPQVRYWIWLVASVKFLIPFALLVAVGRQFGWAPSASIVPPELTLAIDAMSQPFSQSAPIAAVPAESSIGVARALSIVLATAWLGGSAFILLTWWARWRRVAAIVRKATPVESGPELDALRRLEGASGIRRPIALVSSDTSLEPGVFGIARPVLLWPRSLAERLEGRQVEAILAHELVHVRRRDNLAAAVHMVVEAAFWFHPLVWWVGTRLVDERERACDAEVIRLGSDPQSYAEGILKMCQLYLESPLDCVAGVTGSNLKKRIEAIMRNEAAAALNGWRKVLLATVGTLAVVAPVTVGLLNGPSLRAQSAATEISSTPFASASVRANTSEDPRQYPMTLGPDGKFAVRNTTLRALMPNVYGLPAALSPRLLPSAGGPSWYGTDRFDIEAQAEGNPSREQMLAMVRRLLVDRFNLVAHTEARLVPVYSLVVAQAGTLGPRVRPSTCTGRDTVVFSSGPLDPKAPRPMPCGGTRVRPTGTLEARWQTMEELAGGLSVNLGRKVLDRTGLTGKFDLEAEWTPAPGPPKTASLGVGPATFTAIEEQLGLRLNEETGPVDTLVIDNLERPIEDR